MVVVLVVVEMKYEQMGVASLPVASFSYIIHHLNGETHPNQPWHWTRGNLRLLGQRLGLRIERESIESHTLTH